MHAIFVNPDCLQSIFIIIQNWTSFPPVPNRGGGGFFGGLFWFLSTWRRLLELCRRRHDGQESVALIPLFPLFRLLVPSFTGRPHCRIQMCGWVYWIRLSTCIEVVAARARAPCRRTSPLFAPSSSSLARSPAAVDSYSEFQLGIRVVRFFFSFENFSGKWKRLVLNLET